MKTYVLYLLNGLIIVLLFNCQVLGQKLTYPIVETNQTVFYNNNNVIAEPESGASFFGQDATYTINKPYYIDKGNGVIFDNITGLMWQQNLGEKLSFEDAQKVADTLTLGGYTDWRVPTIKELYSLILFTGSNGNEQDENSWVPYIDTQYFEHKLGNTEIGERIIDGQTWSSTEYVGRTMNNDETVFGVNFIDGRIKGYPKYRPGSQTPNTMYFRFVRGNEEYGKNKFIDNNDGTISDLATGLMWQQIDDGVGKDWETALDYAENIEYAGYNDWRLPDAKELNSIVDYTRSPQTTQSPAIDPIFSTTEISDPDGNSGQYPYFWSSTTHLDGINFYGAAVYFAFGEAQGKMNNMLMDVHGAGAQRSDPKTGNQEDYPTFFGPQGDVRYVFNFVRCVRTISETSDAIEIEKNNESIKIYPNPVNYLSVIRILNCNGAKLSVYNHLGQIIHKDCIDTDNHIIPFENFYLSKGIYIVNISKGGRNLSNKKFMVN